MIRQIPIVLMVTALLGGCASYYDRYDDVYGYGNSYGYDDSYVVDEVVYGGHSYGGFAGPAVGGFGGGVGFGLGYAHDPYWRSSAFSLFYNDFPSYYVWSPYRRLYPGFGYNYGFGFGNTFFGGYRYADFGFGHWSPFYGYTDRPRFSYFGFYSPTYYSPTYYYDYGHRDRRVVVRSPRAPSARNEARRLAGNAGPGVFATRAQPNGRLRAKQEYPAAAGSSRTAANRPTRGPVNTAGNRAGSPAVSRARRDTGRSRSAANSGRSAGRTSAQGFSQGASRSTAGRQQTGRRPDASRNTRVLSPRARGSTRSTDQARQRSTSTSRPVKLEQGGRALVTRPTPGRQNGARTFSSRQQTRSRPTVRSTGSAQQRGRGFTPRVPANRQSAAPASRSTNRSANRSANAVATRPAVRSTARTAPRPASRPNVRSTGSRKPAAINRPAVNRSVPQSRAYRPSTPRQPVRQPAPRMQQRAPAPRQSARSAPPQRNSSGRSRSGNRGRGDNN